MIQLDEQRYRKPYEAWLINEGKPERRGIYWLSAVMRPTGVKHIHEIPLVALRAIYASFYTSYPPADGIIIK